MKRITNIENVKLKVKVPRKATWLYTIIDTSQAIIYLHRIKRKRQRERDRDSYLI